MKRFANIATKVGRVAPFASAAIELTVNRVTQNNPWGKDLLTVGAGASIGWVAGASVVAAGTAMGFATAGLLLSIPFAIGAGTLASWGAGKLYNYLAK